MDPFEKHQKQFEGDFKLNTVTVGESLKRLYLQSKTKKPNFANGQFIGHSIFYKKKFFFGEKQFFTHKQDFIFFEKKHFSFFLKKNVFFWKLFFGKEKKKRFGWHPCSKNIVQK